MLAASPARLALAIAAFGTSLAQAGAVGWPLLALILAATVWIGTWVLSADLLRR